MSEVIRYSASRLKFEGGEMISSVTAPWIVVLAHDFDVEHNLRLEAERQGAAYKESRERLGLELGKAMLRADHFERQAGGLREQLAAETGYYRSTLRNVLKDIRDDIVRGGLAPSWGGVAETISVVLNTTSTEGKDHD